MDTNIVDLRTPRSHLSILDAVSASQLPCMVLHSDCSTASLYHCKSSARIDMQRTQNEPY